jgi:hypothetical protein
MRAVAIELVPLRPFTREEKRLVPAVSSPTRVSSG